MTVFIPRAPAFVAVGTVSALLNRQPAKLRSCMCHGPCVSKERGRTLFLSVFILTTTVCVIYVLPSSQGRDGSAPFYFFSCNLGDCFLTCNYVWFSFNKTFHFCNFISAFLFFSSFVSQRPLDTISPPPILCCVSLGRLCCVLGSFFKCIAG